MTVAQTQASPGNAGRRALPYVLIVLATLAAHGLQLVSDVRAADDWMYFHWMENGQWGLFKRFHDAYNNGLQAAALWPLSWFPGVPNAMHAASTFFMAGIGILVYRVSLATVLLSRTESVLIAILAVVYPAYMWHVSASYSVFYHLPVISFYAALLVAMRSEYTAGVRKLLFQGVALALFLFSFHTGSLLVFFYGAALVHCRAIALARSISFPRAVLFYTVRRMHFWISPFAFRAAYHFIGHPFINNELRVDLPTFLSGMQGFAMTLFAQARAVVLSGVFWWTAAAALLAVASAIVLRRASVRPTPGGLRDACLALACGLVLLFLSIFAYLAVGKTPSPDAIDGYTTRTLIIAQVPLALIAVAVLRLLALSRFSSLLVYPVAAGLIASSVVIQVQNTVKWMAYSVLDRAFYFNLARIPKAREVTYFIVVDRAFYMATIHHPTASLPFEIADIFHGSTHVFADLLLSDFDMSKARQAQSSLRELAARYDTPSVIDLVQAWEIEMPTEYRQGVLVVCPGPAFRSYSPSRLVALYQYHRWIDREHLQQFLTPLLRLHLTTSDSVANGPSPGADVYGCEQYTAKH